MLPYSIATLGHQALASDAASLLIGLQDGHSTLHISPISENPGIKALGFYTEPHRIRAAVGIHGEVGPLQRRFGEFALDWGRASATWPPPGRDGKRGRRAKPAARSWPMPPAAPRAWLGRALTTPQATRRRPGPLRCQSIQFSYSYKNTFYFGVFLVPTPLLKSEP